MIFRLGTSRAVATVSRDLRTIWLAARPRVWILEGFPKLVDKLSDIAVMTSGRSGVVAALSKYIILFFLPFVVISGYFYKDLIFFVKVSVLSLHTLLIERL